jgi:hypothetical protein
VTWSQQHSTRTIAGRQNCFDLMPELQGMILMDQWPEEFDPNNGEVHG